uniref:Uncharacterized protein n=1 Tax=Arundo donax TaxID=35708 RepID=A0A0A9F333_ARUDO
MRTTSVTAPSLSGGGSDGNYACLDARLDFSSSSSSCFLRLSSFPPPLASVSQEQLLWQQFLPGDGPQPPVRPLTPFLDQLGVMQGTHHPAALVITVVRLVLVVENALLGDNRLSFCEKASRTDMLALQELHQTLQPQA